MVSIQRVRVVGDSGSGKTTFARRLASRLGVPHRELDEVFLGPNWQQRDNDEAVADLRTWLEHHGTDGWVVDGNWNTRIGTLLDDADIIVWLDYSRTVIMTRVIRRTLGRALLRRRTYHGNRERMTAIFRRDPEDNIIMWAWTAYSHYQQLYGDLAARDTRVVRLASPRQARQWLDGATGISAIIG